MGCLVKQERLTKVSVYRKSKPATTKLLFTTPICILFIIRNLLLSDYPSRKEKHPHLHRTPYQTIKMAGDSKVGTSGVYEAGDQRNHKNEELDNAERFEEGKENSHQATDSSMFLLRSKF